MRAIFQQAVFQAGDESWTWLDIFASARLSGLWDALEHRVARGIACRKKLEASGEALLEQDVDQECEEFRYDRDLVSAEEMEEWLQRRKLAVEEWMEFIERKILMSHWTERLEEILLEFPVSAEEVLEAIEAEGICSGEFQRFALELAGQAALEAAGRGSVEDAEVASFLDNLPAGLRSHPRIDRLSRMKLAAERYRREGITDEMIQSWISTHEMDMIRLRIRTAHFRDLATAAEAALCVREGDTPTMVSGFAGAALVTSDCYLGDLDPIIAAALASARIGEVVGPLATSKGDFVLIQVVDKQPPAAGNPALLDRAKEKLIQGLLQYEVNQHVRWLPSHNP